jgi:RHS repeat-associated protein
VEAGQELDTLGNARRIRGGASYSLEKGDPPSDIGGYRYTAFGRTVTAPDTAAPTVFTCLYQQPLRWQGRWYTEMAGGLYDFRSRVWSPELGAFLMPDEFGFLTSTGTLWSWPGQNPYRWRDPDGEFGRGAFVTLGAILGADIGLTAGIGTGILETVGTGGPGIIAAPGTAIARLTLGATAGGIAGGSIYDASQALGDWLDGAMFAQRGKGNVGDTGIEDEMRKLIERAGPGALDVCTALEMLMDAANAIQDQCERAAKKEKIKRTQKKFNCRRSRQGRE